MKTNGSITLVTVEDGKDGVVLAPSLSVLNIPLDSEGWAIEELDYEITLYAYSPNKQYSIKELNLEYSGAGWDTYSPSQPPVLSRKISGNKFIIRSLPDSEMFGGDMVKIVATVADGDGDFALTTFVQVTGTREVQGRTGSVVRRTEWQAGKDYRNGKVQDADGNYYLDEVVVSDWDGGNGKRFLCRTNHTSKQSDRNDSNETLGSNWTVITAQKPIYTPFADITRAVIDYLQSKQLTITDKDGKMYGAFGGGDTPLWFGGESADKATFVVQANGTIKINPTEKQKEEAVSYMEIKSEFGGVYFKIRDNTNYVTINISPLGVKIANDNGNFVSADFNQITCYINRQVVFAASQNRVTILDRNVYWDSAGYLRAYT